MLARLFNNLLIFLSNVFVLLYFFVMALLCLPIAIFAMTIALLFEKAREGR